MPCKWPKPPRWVHRNRAELSVFHRGVLLGLAGEPAPKSGELWLVLHAGWKAGTEMREAKSEKESTR